jgi:hypothetical protein
MARPLVTNKGINTTEYYENNQNPFDTRARSDLFELL